MKKVLLCLFCMMFFLQGCGKDHEGEPIELTAQEVLVRLQDPKKNSFMLYITSENCYSCDEYEKIIQEIEEETPFEIYYLKMDTNEEDTDVKRSLEELQITTGNIQSLPSTFYFYQGSLLPENKKEGYLEKKDLLKWLNDLHLLH